jgi:hypothetical protein
VIVQGDLDFLRLKTSLIELMIQESWKSSVTILCYPYRMRGKMVQMSKALIPETEEIDLVK